ncbi:MAG: Hpt domain-containing protein [Planctomycetota bacterium]|jgi:HPt (histidine-containing phosphotransfer) domain-containing protein
MADNSKSYDSSLSRRRQSELEQEEAWAQLAAKYLRDLPRQLDRIRSTAKVKNYSAIKKQAHRIKGTSGTYHLDAISKSVARLERLADSQNPVAIVTAVNKVMQLVKLETERLNSRLVIYWLLSNITWWDGDMLTAE